MHSVEQVEVFYEKSGKTVLYPDLTPRSMQASVAYINSYIGKGVKLSESEILGYLAKTGLLGKIVQVDGESVVEVQIPPTRSDILHACDIMEDVAVAFGINRIPKTVPKTSTVGKPFPLNKLSDYIRRELAFCGWSEVLPLTLVCLLECIFDQIRKRRYFSAPMPKITPFCADKTRAMRLLCWLIPKH